MGLLLSAHQPAYLPWLGYLNKIARADVFVILDEVQFERGSYVNRNRILTANGPVWLTVPVTHKGHMGATIRDLLIVGDKWQRKHRDTMRQAYGSDCFGCPARVDGAHLCDMIATSMSGLLEELDIRTPVLWLSEMGHSGHKQDLILSLCHQFGADRFLFGANGRDYVDVELFRKRGVEPLFQDFKCLPYPQRHTREFVPALSVVDALYNVGPEETRRLILEGYKP